MSSQPPTETPEPQERVAFDRLLRDVAVMANTMEMPQYILDHAVQAFRTRDIMHRQWSNPRAAAASRTCVRTVLNWLKEEDTYLREYLDWLGNSLRDGHPIHRMMRAARGFGPVDEPPKLTSIGRPHIPQHTRPWSRARPSRTAPRCPASDPFMTALPCKRERFSR